MRGHELRELSEEEEGLEATVQVVTTAERSSQGSREEREQKGARRVLPS